jgi:hypothetical protein
MRQLSMVRSKTFLIAKNFQIFAVILNLGKVIMNNKKSFVFITILFVLNLKAITSGLTDKEPIVKDVIGVCDQNTKVYHIPTAKALVEKQFVHAEKIGAKATAYCDHVIEDLVVASCGIKYLQKNKEKFAKDFVDQQNLLHLFKAISRS